VTAPAPSPPPHRKMDAETLLQKLREYLEEKGGRWEEGWRVEIKPRLTGNSAGSSDAVSLSVSQSHALKAAAPAPPT
jgi:hypothetical protein